MPKRTEWLEQFILNTEDLENDYRRAADTFLDLNQKTEQARRVRDNLRDMLFEKQEIYSQITGHDWDERSWADA